MEMPMPMHGAEILHRCFILSDSLNNYKWNCMYLLSFMIIRFYKVAANDTIIWFQLCDGMIFNHDPLRCADCWDCGGSSRCGMGCSALVAQYSTAVTYFENTKDNTKASVILLDDVYHRVPLNSGHI
ncbi:uncharacterized protein [Spinacia oleracea]|nr:uncharacterized protein LOC110787528 isoform X2 [Spinacia oleracea]